MKRIISLILVLSMMLSLCACGGGGSSAILKSDDDPVEIYLSVMDFEGEGAEAYIESLRETNPDKEYKYYNEEYYILVVTEGERKKTLEEYKDLSKVLSDAFSVEYPGLISEVELSDDMNALTFHLNSEVLEENAFAAYAILILGAVYLDNVQGYNLIDPENRNPRLICVNENGEVIMDSNELGN